MSPSPCVVVADQELVSTSKYEGSSSSSSSSRDRRGKEIRLLIPTQGITVFFCIVLALLLKAGEFDEIMESLKIAFDIVGPLLAPLILAVCGYLFLDVT